MESNLEIECRFLEINKDALIKKLRELDASDRGEDMFHEFIFYDKDLTWKNTKKMVRVRKTKDNVSIAYKFHQFETIDGTQEIELNVDSMEQAKLFLESVGLCCVREQEKIRHTFLLDDVSVDIDTFPLIPTYVELEGESEIVLKKTAAKLGFDWKDAVFENPRIIIEKHYHIPVSSYHLYTFAKSE